MRYFLLLVLWTAGALGAAPTVTITGTDSLSHSTVRIFFNVNAPYYNARARYIPTVQGSCTSGTGGTVEGMSAATYFTSGMTIVVAGLTPSTQYQICPEVTADNSTWSSGAGVTVTTLALPAVHPALPIAPATFDTSYPNVTGYTSVTVASNCSNFSSLLSSAISASATTGTIINIPAGTVCSAVPYIINQPSPDARAFSPNNVSTANNTMTIANHGLTEGQGIIFGKVYAALPSSSSCTNGIVTGQLYYAHVLDSNTLQVYCGGSPSNGGTLMTFSDQGSTSAGPGGNQLYLAPWPHRLKWVIVRTATPDSQLPPEHTRITPAWKPKMASFVKPASTVGINTGTTLFTIGNFDANIQFPVANIRFVGIEFTTQDSPEAHISSDPVPWGNLITTQAWDQNIIFDRCYIHGQGTPNRITNGFYWDGMNQAIVDSYFENLQYFHSAYFGLGVTKTGSNSLMIAPGTHHMGAATATLGSTVSASISGSGSGAGFVYFDWAGNLKISLPPGVTGTCSGGPCTIFTGSSSPGNGVYVYGNGSVFPSQNSGGTGYWVDPIFSVSATPTTTTNLFTTAPTGSFIALNPVEVGIRFTSDVSGYVLGVRFYKASQDTGTHTGSLWTSGGALLATGNFTNETASGWQQLILSSPVAITANTVYVVSYHSNTGVVLQPKMLRNGTVDNGPLHSIAAYSGGAQSCNYSSDWPADAFGNPIVGQIGCVNISNGAISSIMQADASTSLFITEGCNFMIGGLGPGPYMFLNNFVEGAGLLWHHDDGGGSVRTRGDYTYIRNTFYEPFSLMLGSPVSDGLRYYHRQPLEWKGGQRMNLLGNIFDGSWAEDTSSSVFVALTSRNGQGISDVDVNYNTFQHGPGGLNAPEIIPGNAPETPPTPRFRLTNNLFWDLSGDKYSEPWQSGEGWVLEGPLGNEDIIIDHNTIVGNRGHIPVLLFPTDTFAEGVQVTNNIFSVDTYGGIGQQNIYCNGVLGKALADCVFPGYRWDHNLMLGNGVTQSWIQSRWPNLINYIPSDMTLANQGWFSFNPSSVGTFQNGNSTSNNFRFKSTSRFCSGCSTPASDWKDVGADMDALEAAQGNVTLIGVPASSTTANSAAVAFVAPDTAGCSVDYSSSDPTLINTFTRVSDTGGNRARSVTLSGLNSQTVYYYRVNCAVQQPTGQFRTR